MQSQQEVLYFTASLGKTHIKKSIYLVVGPLRGGGEGDKPPITTKLKKHFFSSKEKIKKRIKIRTTKVQGRGYQDLSGSTTKKILCASSQLS